MRLLITRHGQTDWNVQGKTQGRTDIELNETGIRQAEEVREKLLSQSIDIIISSTLKRAKKTAQIIAQGRKIPIIYDEDIVERSFGIYEGEKLKGEDFDRIKETEGKGVETDEDLLKRITRFLGKIKQEYQDKTVLVVTHKGTALAMCCRIDGLEICTKNTSQYQIENCAVVEYDL